MLIGRIRRQYETSWPVSGWVLYINAKLVVQTTLYIGQTWRCIGGQDRLDPHMAKAQSISVFEGQAVHSRLKGQEQLPLSVGSYHSSGTTLLPSFSDPSLCMSLFLIVLYLFIFWLGERREMHHAPWCPLAPCVGLQRGLPLGQWACWTRIAAWPTH